MTPAPLRAGRGTRILALLEGGFAAAVGDVAVACPGAGGPCDADPSAGFERVTRAGLALGLERGAVAGRTLRLTAGAGRFVAPGGASGPSLSAALTGTLPLRARSAVTAGLATTYLPDFDGTRLALPSLRVGLRLAR